MSPFVEASCDVTGRGLPARAGCPLRELLAELDAPLVEAVDVPDDPLDEDLVLVHRDQRAERARRDLAGRRSRSSGGCRRTSCAARARRSRSAEPSSPSSARTSSGVLPRISASVCAKKFASRISWCCAHRVVRLDRRDEVGRDDARALVDQLVERVLAVRARLAPDDRPGRVVGDPAGPRGRRPCRSTPCRPAGSTRRSGACTGRTAGSRGSRRRRSSSTRRRACRGSPAGSPRAARCGSARPSRGRRRAAPRSGRRRSRSMIDSPIALHSE